MHLTIIFLQKDKEKVKKNKIKFYIISNSKSFNNILIRTFIHISIHINIKLFNKIILLIEKETEELLI